MNIYKFVYLFLFFLFCGCAQNKESTIIDKLRYGLHDQSCADVLPVDAIVMQNYEKNPIFFYLKGLCEKRTGNNVQAKADLSKALQMNIWYRTNALLQLASIEMRLNEPDSALHHLSLLTQTNYRTTGKGLLKHKDFDPIRTDDRFQRLLRQLHPAFSFWTSLFLFVSLQAFFIAVILFLQRKSLARASVFLGWLMLSFAITIFSYVLYWTGYNYDFPYLNMAYHPLMFVAGPLFYLYIRNVVTKNKYKETIANANGIGETDKALRLMLRTDKRKNILHFAPAILCFLLLSPWILRHYITINMLEVPNSLFQIGTNYHAKVIHLIIYAFLSFRIVYGRGVEKENVHSWLQYLTWAFAGYVLMILLYYILIRFPFFSPTWDYMISFAMSFFIFIVGFMGYLQPRISTGETVREIIVPPKYQKSGLTENAELNLKKKIEELMQNEQFFINADFRLNDLAEAVGSSRHNVSLVINKYYNKNYFNFVNAYRIDYVKKMLHDPKYMKHTIIELAYEAGFNNKVSFNKAFKKQVGMTPTEYRKKHVIE